MKAFVGISNAGYLLYTDETAKLAISTPATRHTDIADLRKHISLLLDMSDDKVFPSAHHIGRIIGQPEETRHAPNHPK